MSGSNFSGELALFLSSCAGFRSPPEEHTDNRPEFRIRGYWRLVSVAYARKNPATTIARLADANQRYLRWPTDKMGKSVQSRKWPYHTAEEAVTLYRRDLIAGSLPFTIDDVRRELKSKDLVCWSTPGAPCHADVLIAVANGEG